MAAIICLLALGPSPATASEAPAAAAAESLIGPASQRLTVDKQELDSKHFWVWSAGRRGYYLSGFSNGFDTIWSVDLDSGEKMSAPLEYPGFDNPYVQDQTLMARGTERTVAVDEAGGRLFVATMTPPVQAFPADANRYTRDAGMAANRTSHGAACAQIRYPDPVRCLTGVSVVDATTLAHVRHIPFRSVQADAPILAPQLLAMAYAPAFDGQAAKLHLVVQELLTGPAVLDGQTSNVNPRRITNVTYLVQMDPETGSQDWVVRLDSCRGSRPGRGTTDHKRVEGIHHQAALFRSRMAGDHSVYVACWSAASSLTGAVVRVPLSDSGTAIAVPTTTAVDSQRLSSALERPYTVEGPDEVYEFLADPDSGRFALQVMDGKPLAQVWWVFDTRPMQFVGTIGIGGPVVPGSSMSTIAPETGRLYVLADARTMGGRSFPGGLFVADLRRTPVPQALHYPELETAFPPETAESAVNVTYYLGYRYALEAQTLPGGGTRIWFPGPGFVAPPIKDYLAIDDRRPLEIAPPPDTGAGRTLDLVEREGITTASADGAARGYGARMLLVGGAEALTRLGPFDPVGNAASCNDPQWDLLGMDTTIRGGPCNQPLYASPVSAPMLPVQCAQGNREIVLASVGPEGPAVVDSTGARGAAQPLVVDSLTRTDTSSPVSRCTGKDWDQVWGTALFGRAPIAEPATGEAATPAVANCVSSSDTPTASVGDPVTNGYSAEVQCEDQEASGSAYARGFSVDSVSVGEALSSFRVYRDPARGIVSRVESVARGIGLEGVVRIDAVRGTAESWANGRQQPIDAADRDAGYLPNCDFDRTAGTCFTRQLFGLWTPGYACGPCGDEAQFVQAINAFLNPGVLVRLREPDAVLRQGSENGFTAAIQKPESERFADLALNTDLLQTVLPTLEVIRFAPANRQFSRGGARGRQIYQFAGVEVSSSYGIQCLLVYDEATNTCAAEEDEPGSITVNLTDADGKALAGGAFEVRQDADTDGLVGLKDALLPEGACVTADDGVGTCTFDALQPGSYLVSQVAAPPGYGKVPDAFVVELASGEARTVTFQNTSNVSTVAVSAADEAGKPVSGAVFAVYPDGDSDGKVAADAQPAATCTTDASGGCSMQVPAGSYVLVQMSAPGGLEPIEPVAFTFASGGQTAAVGVVNYPAGGVPPVEPAASPIEYSAPPQQVVTETVNGYQPTSVAEGPQVSVPEVVGGTIMRVIEAPGDALRLLSRDPKQAVAWTASLMLFALALMAVRRRQQALQIIKTL